MEDSLAERLQVDTPDWIHTFATQCGRTIFRESQKVLKEKTYMF